MKNNILSTVQGGLLLALLCLTACGHDPIIDDETEPATSADTVPETIGVTIAEGQHHPFNPGIEISDADINAD